MDATFGSSDVESLICSIKKFPQIWDPSCENYKNRHSRKAAWEDVCKVFKEDFEDLNQTEQDDLARRFMRKWKNIKDAFMKSYRIKKSGKNRHHTYLYEKQLSFLNKLAGDFEEHEENEDKISKPTSSHQSTSRQQSPLPKRRKTGEPTVEYVAVPMDVPKQPDIDEDTSFFNSLLPIVKQFDADQKLDFRSEVLNIIKNIRLSSAANRDYNFSANTSSYCHELNLKEDLS